MIFAGDDTTDEDAMKVNINPMDFIANLFTQNFDKGEQHVANIQFCKLQNTNSILI